MVSETKNNNGRTISTQNARLVNINNNKYYDSYANYMNERHDDNTYQNNKRMREEGCYNANACSTINNELNFVNNTPSTHLNIPISSVNKRIRYDMTTVG